MPNLDLNTKIVLIFLLLSVVLVLIFLFSKAKPLVKTIFKGIASIGFIVLGFVTYFLFSFDNIFILLLVGLIFGAVGDVLLGLKDVGEKRSSIFMVGGMGAFLVGHIFYIIFFAIKIQSFWIHLSVIAGALALAAIIIFGGSRLKCEYDNMLLPTIFYAVTISCMLIYSIVNIILSCSVGSLMFFIAAVFFSVSDIILCFLYFRKKTPLWLVPINLSTYYIAQNLIALAPLFFIL